MVADPKNGVMTSRIMQYESLVMKTLWGAKGRKGMRRGRFELSWLMGVLLLGGDNNTRYVG